MTRRAHDLGEDDYWVYDDDKEDEDDIDDDWVYYDDEAEAEEEAKRPAFLKVDDGFEVINEKEKLLIFASGTKGRIAHQVRGCFFVQPFLYNFAEK
jgi:hypothetical protein